LVDDRKKREKQLGLGATKGGLADRTRGMGTLKFRKC